MTIDSHGRGETLLIKAGALLQLSADVQSREKAFALATLTVEAGAKGGHAIPARMYQLGLGTRRHQLEPLACLINDRPNLLF